MIQGTLFKMDDGKSVKNLSAPIVFNIGYQGHTVQSFIKKLRLYKVQLLVDLRSRPYSRKPDFNRQRLEKELANFGIKYMWRGKTLGGFGVSRETWIETLKGVAGHAGKENICLMCMEANVNQCHRKELAAILRDEYGVQTLNL